MRKLIVSLALVLSTSVSAEAFAYDFYKDQKSINVRFSCHSLKDLQKALGEVVNEQQVYNANTGSDVWTNKSGCVIQYPGRSFIYKSAIACEVGIWGCQEVGFWGWLKTDKFLIQLWRVGHPREVVNFRGRAINLGDDRRWTVGRMYRRANARLSMACERRILVREGVTIYGHQLGHGNSRDATQADACEEPPMYRSSTVQGQRDRQLTPDQIKAKEMLERHHRER